MQWLIICFFFFTDTTTTEIYTLSLHDALPILRGAGVEYRCSPQRPQSDSVPAVEYYETSGGHMRTVRLTLVTLAVAVLAGGAPLRAQRRGNVLSTEEIERAKSTVGPAYALVQTLLPRWLHVHELT